MLRHVHWESTLFDGADDPKEAELDLCWLMEALVQRNQDYLKQHPYTPNLYKSGVVWEAPKQFDGECTEVSILKKALGKAARQGDVRRVLERVQDVFGGEHFCDIGVILELGAIDCDGIACWRAAELRQRKGIRARAMMTSRPRIGGGTTYHALVRWPPFGRNQFETTEDSSLLLGMHQPERKAERDEEIRKNLERCEDMRRMGGQPLEQPPDFDAVLQEVLGLRRPVKQAVSARALFERLKRAA